MPKEHTTLNLSEREYTGDGSRTLWEKTRYTISCVKPVFMALPPYGIAKPVEARDPYAGLTSPAVINQEVNPPPVSLHAHMKKKGIILPEAIARDKNTSAERTR